MPPEIRALPERPISESAEPLPEPEGTEQPDGVADPGGQPWDEPDFSAVYTPNVGEFYADGGETYRKGPRGPVRICGFVAEPVSEVTTVHNLDNPVSDTTSVVSMRITTPGGDVDVVDVGVNRSTSMSAAIIEAVPSAVARLSVERRGDVAPAASAFRVPDFTQRRVSGQTGWRCDGGFAFPGSEDVSLTRLGESANVHLFGVPSEPDALRAAHGAETLARVCLAAPTESVTLLLGTIAAGPMFRRADHLGARGFLVHLVGPSQRGKTLLLSRLYCVLGAFYRQPMCVARWEWTKATLEAHQHTLRDLPLLFDNFRLADGDARAKFRAVVMALGDGAGRGRSTWTPSGTRVVGAPTSNSLVISTGENEFDDDAAVNGRLLQVTAEGIDVDALMAIRREDLDSLPHLYSAFIHFLQRQTGADWAQRRATMESLAGALRSRAAARTSENLATVAVALATFCDFGARMSPAHSRQWTDLAQAFVSKLPSIAADQACRVRDDRIDETVLREVARAIRQGKAYLESIQARRNGPTVARGILLGAYDTEHIYVIPDVLTQWASAELRAAGRRRDPIGRKELGWAFEARPGGEVGRVQRTIGARVQGAWPIRRDGLGETWTGLLDDPPRQASNGHHAVEE